MTTHTFRISLLALSVSALTACGGGGGGGGNTGNEVIEPTPDPVVNPALALINHDADSQFNGTGVRVAIYDSGINANHDQFEGLALSQFSGSFYSFTTIDSNSNVVRNLAETPNDDEDEDFSATNNGRAGHGTAVASALLGVSGGVSPDVELTFVDVNNAEETDSNNNVIDVDPIAVRPDSSAALLHTAENADILGLNFANYSITNVSTVIVEDGISNEAIWDDIAATDIAMIAAAGNEGYSYSDIFVNTATVPECTDQEYDNSTGYERERCSALRFDRGTDYPTALIPEYQDLIITVGAVSSSFELERYSNFPGDDCGLQERWMVAPGTVGAADYDSDTNIVTQSGTSFATPLVTGAAAAVAEAFPSLSNRAVLRLLLSTADQSFAGYNAEEHGQGLLDLEAALAATPSNYADGVPNNLREICAP
jgi:subtilisin family serine protease